MVHTGNPLGWHHVIFGEEEGPDWQPGVLLSGRIGPISSSVRPWFALSDEAAVSSIIQTGLGGCALHEQAQGHKHGQEGPGLGSGGAGGSKSKLLCTDAKPPEPSPQVRTLNQPAPLGPTARSSGPQSRAGGTGRTPVGPAWPPFPRTSLPVKQKLGSVPLPSPP